MSSTANSSASSRPPLPLRSNRRGSGSADSSLEEPMPPLDGNNNINNNNNNNNIEEEEEEEDEEKNVESLNKLSTNYTVPTTEEDKGDLQKYMQNDLNLNPQQKMVYIIMLASVTLGFTVDEWQPYKKYMEINKEKKGQGWKTLNPTKKLVVAEIQRRNPNFKANIKNKSLYDLMNELQNVCSVDQKDTDYICHLERQTRLNIQAMINNHLERTDATKEKTPQQTRADRMRLICCFQDESIVEAYKKSQEVMVRTQLDARNSDQRGPNFYDLIVEKFNDSSWIPKSAADETLHEDFVEEHEWPKREEYTIDVDKVKKIFAMQKGHISAVLRAYSKSGNGAVNADEMYQLGDEEDEEFTAHYGHFDLDRALVEGGDDRKNFLRGKPTDVLYWWKVLDELQLITLTCVAMRKELGADSSSRPVSIAELTSKKRGKKRKSMTDSLTATATALEEKLDSMNNTVKDLRVDSLKKEKMELMRQYYVTDKDAPEEYRAVLKERIDEIGDMLKKME